ncbi:MAG: WD40 repeat domain-containing protein [Candidatus Acidiferrales bacterium]
MLRVLSEGGAPAVEWAPDGKILIAARGLLGRFDLDSSQEELLDSAGLSFALSPDGARLALAGTNRLELHNYPGLEESASLPLPESAAARALVAVAWSPDGETLAVGTHTGHIHLWDVETQELWADLGVEPPAGVSRLAFSADSARLLTAFEDGRAVLWDIEQQREVHRFDRPQGEQEAVVVALSPDGQRVLTTRIRLREETGEAAEDAEIVLLNDAGRELWRRAGYAVEFTRDGSGVLALTPPYRIAALYRTADAEALRVFEPPEFVRSLYVVRHSPDGAKLLGIGEDETANQVMVVWDFASARVLKTRR